MPINCAILRSEIIEYNRLIKLDNGFSTNDNSIITTSVVIYFFRTIRALPTADAEHSKYIDVVNRVVNRL